MRPDSRFFSIGLKSALFAGAVVAAVAGLSVPASAQQRGTGVVEGPAGGGGGGGGGGPAIQRPAAQAPRAVSPRMMAPQAGVAQRYANPRAGAAQRYAGPQAGFAQRYQDPQAAAAQRIYPEQTYRQGNYPRGRYTPRDRRRWYGPSIVTVPAPYGYDWGGSGAYDPYYDAPYAGQPVYGAPYYGGYEAYPPADAYPAPVYPGPVAVGRAQGQHCETPQKVCQLYDPAPIGIGCSCRAPAGQPRFRGQVIP